MIQYIFLIIREGSNREIEEQKDIKYLENNIKIELRF